MNRTGSTGTLGSAAARIAACAAAAAMLTACGSSLNAYDIRLALGEDLAASATLPDLTVDVVGVPPAEARVLTARPVRSHFSAGDATRERLRASGALRSFDFGRANRTDRVIAAGDAAWNSAWADAETIVVLASLPGARADGAGDSVRRIELPRSSDAWPRGFDGVTITIEERELVPSPRPSGG